MRFPYIHSAEDMARLIDEIGFLPFFRNEIEGFSIEDITPSELWFSPDVPGPWEWKGPVIHMCGASYGKLYQGKAMYVSKEFFKDFANLRRDGYDFDSRLDEGLVRYDDARLYATLDALGPSLSKTLKAASGYSGNDKMKGFDGAMTRLQMQCYALTADFEYQVDKNGKRYGWGVARYATPEQLYGESFREGLYARSPESSYELLLKHLKGVLKDVDESKLSRLLKL